MSISNNSNNLLAVLDDFTLDSSEDIALQVAHNFRRRRVEKNLSREAIAKKSEVPLSTVARFEQKGLISFDSLIKLAMALGYTSEVKNIFATEKYATMAELDLIHRKINDKRAYTKKQ